MSGRTGVTLIEVLVAIFVTALGLLGLLALFPLGALNMAQAVREGRATAAAINAGAIAETWQIRNDPLVVGLPGDAFVDADYPSGVATPRPRADLLGPSYPVYVDPLGFSGNATTKVLPTPSNMRIAGKPVPGIPRRNVSFVNSPPAPLQPLQAAIRWFTILDDVTFQKDQYQGLPCPPPGVLQPPGANVESPSGVVQREPRYSWAYLLRRPRSNERSVVDLTVVVYSGRPLLINLGETAYGPVTFDPASNNVKVYWTQGLGQGKPAIRPGSWILDATMVNTLGGPDPHGFFYRVVGVSEGADAQGSYLILELETKPKLGTTVGVLVLLDSVVEVFEKGPGRNP